MQKVFRLLRHNTETGPFTIGELLQQQIGPDDLIWVDGESTAWAYPQEMENLKYALSPNDLLKKESHKKETPVLVEAKPVREIKSAIHLSPAVEIESKAEELRQRILSFKKQPGYEPAAWTQHEHAPILPMAENDVEISYHKKKGLPVGEVLMGAMVISLLTLGWYGGGKNLFRQQKEVASAVAVKLSTTEENTAIGTPEVTHTDSTVVAVNHTDSLTTTDNRSNDYLVQTAPKKTAVLPPSDSGHAVPKEEPVAAQQALAVPTEKKEEPKITKPSLIQPETKAPAKSGVEPSDKTEEQTTVEPEEKKKGFHLFKGLFKKKKKGDDKPAEDGKPEGQ